MNDRRRAQIKHHLEQAKDLSPAMIDPEGHVSRGNAYFSLGDNDAAENEFAAAIEQRPTYVNAHFNLGVVYLRTGRAPEAELAFLTVLGLATAQDVLLPEARYCLAVALREQKRYAEALRSAISATEGGGDPEFKYLRAQLHATLSQVHESAEWLGKAISARPRYREVARTDAAFDSVRSTPELRALLDKSA